MSVAPKRLHGQEEANRLEVEIGEGGVFVVDVGEAERAPEAVEFGSSTPESSETWPRV